MKPKSNADLAFRGAFNTQIQPLGLVSFLILIITLFVVGLEQVHAATYYVATTGNDGNAGTLAAPYRTIGKGAGRLVAGDTLYVRGGTYNEAFTMYQSGTAAAPIKLAAYSGEKPIIDGQNYYPTGDWYGLIHLAGNYIDVSGFELKNSAQRGLVLAGGHDAAHKVIVHDVQSNGILIEGDDCLVEDSEVYRAAMSNENGKASGWAGGLNAARGTDGITTRAVMRRNVVHDNWGEGLSSFEADGTVIEDNTVWNNFSVNLYLSDLRNALVQRNIIYNTTGAPLRNGNVASGITIADENASKPRSSGNSVVNNLVLNASVQLMSWSLVSGSTLDRTLVAHNTVVGQAISTGTQTNGTRVVNNLSNASVVGGNTINAAYFTPKSPATASLLPDVTLDFLNNIRSTSTTLGAIETNAITTPPVTPPVTAVNLALNKPAVASTVEGTSLAAANAFDGNTTTRWSSQFADPQWIYVDLGATYNVNRVKLAWEEAYSRSFLVQVSADQTNWTTIYSTSASTGSTQDLTGLTGVGRYVRMYGQSRVTVYGHSLWEMEVYGTLASTTPTTTNLALNKPATASTVQGTTYSAASAFDGKTTTRWSSKFADPQWIRVDLGGKFNISRVKLVWEAAYSASYKIQVSNDGTTWTDIYSTTAGKGGTVDLTSVTGVGRYLRMYGLSRGTVYGHSLWEMEVYGTAWK